MPKKPIKGDVAVIHAEVHRVWADGRITVHIPGYGSPVTIDQKHIADVQPTPKPVKPPKPKRHSLDDPIWDDPTPKKKA